MKLDIMVNKLRPIKGSSYIPLPQSLSQTKDLINMKNSDQECFKWAVTRALNAVDKDPQRVAKVLGKQSERLDWSGLEFPTPCTEKMFKKFEKNNVSLLAFGHDDRDIIPLYVSPECCSKKTIRLFFFRRGDQSHYCVVNNMSTLVGSQASTKKK